MSYVPYTKRGKQSPKTLTDEIPDVVRNRIWQHLLMFFGGSVDALLDTLGDPAQRTMLEHGDLSRRRKYKAGNRDAAIGMHFFQCDADEFLEFLEFLFRC